MLCTQTLLVIARPVLGGGPSCRDCRSLRARRGLGGVVYRGLVKAGSLGGAIAVLGGAIVGHRAARRRRPSGGGARARDSRRAAAVRGPGRSLRSVDMVRRHPRAALLWALVSVRGARGCAPSGRRTGRDGPRTDLERRGGRESNGSANGPGTGEDDRVCGAENDRVYERLPAGSASGIRTGSVQVEVRLEPVRNPFGRTGRELGEICSSGLTAPLWPKSRPAPASVRSGRNVEMYVLGPCPARP